MSTAIQEGRVDLSSEQRVPPAVTPAQAAEGRGPEQRPAYDPNNLCWLDAQERKYDDTSDGIDWDEIIATTQDDFLAGRFAFNSADYPSHEEAMAALKRWMEDILEEVLRDQQNTASAASPDASRPSGG